MANIAAFPLVVSIVGDGVATSVVVNLGYTPTSASLTVAYNASYADVSANISSVVAGSSNVTINFVAPFSGAIQVVLALSSATCASAQLQTVLVQPRAPAGVRFAQVATSAVTTVPVNKTVYNEQSVNAQRSFSSSSANDTAAGTGCRTIAVHYLDQTGAGPFIEIVTLNGTTPVNTVGTNICFIDVVLAITVGSTGSNVGTITMFTATAGGGTAICTIAPTDNRTLLCHRYTATGVTTYFTGITVGSTSTTTAQGGIYTLQSQKIPTANNPFNAVSGDLVLFGQASSLTRAYTSPIVVVGPARTRVVVTPGAAASLIFYGAIDFFEV
jgi:hypothetical protein